MLSGFVILPDAMLFSLVGSISLVFFGLSIFAPPSSGQVRGKSSREFSHEAAQDSESFVFLCSLIREER